MSGFRPASKNSIFLLLATHVDKLFDRFLLSFQEYRGDFSVVIHPRVKSQVVSLGLKNGMRLNTSQLGFEDARRFERFMNEHLKRYQALVAEDRPTQ